MEQKASAINKYLDCSLNMLNTAHIVLPKKATVNIYHHLGVDNLYDTGAMFINIVNRDYCKSIVVMHPGQQYPLHYHRIKTESFYVLYGKLTVIVDGVSNDISPGEMLHIERGQDHSFSTAGGTIFEEISTMYVPNDSVYLDPKIASKTYTERRTTLKPEQWEEIIQNAKSPAFR